MARALSIASYTVAILVVVFVLAARHPPALPAREEDTKAVGVAEMARTLGELRTALDRDPATVLLVGDSSLIEHEVLAPEQTFRNMIETRGAAAGTPIRVLARRGFDGVAYYSLADAFVTLRPRAVVLLGNLQAFTDAWFGNTKIKHPDLVAFLRPWHVPQALALPLESAGIADATVASLPLLRLVGMTDLPEALRDWRTHFHDTMMDRLGPQPAEASDGAAGNPAPPSGGQAAPIAPVPAPRVPPMGPVPGGRGVRPKAMFQQGLWVTSPFKHPEYYPDHLDAEAPAVRVFAAALRRLSRAGVRTIVLLAPVHLQALRMNTAYKTRDIPGTISVLREVSEANGAAVIDATHTIGEERLFVDAYTHLNEDGNRIFVDETLRQLSALLSSPPKNR